MRPETQPATETAPARPAGQAIPPFDRRLHQRTKVARLAKLFHRAGLAYAAGQTADLSEGGVLLKVHSPRRFEPGDTVDVVIEPKDPTGVVRTRSLIEGIIVRTSPLGDDQQFVAVRFARPRAEFGVERLAA